ncbi:hypothetical protein [Chitinophaga sp. XS-30]|uniref:hypothetical protein n=1 Tax=Chitinophaga sp. XS-30 TaxID=2604421 RepID=UPI0011DCF87F|nr:hypothetical protein [Chitinophaga sp. XS-30]QEH43304.1 hypothetical protein FW415_21545 [Chitinophaga sp. XS-30]
MKISITTPFLLSALLILITASAEAQNHLVTHNFIRQKVSEGYFVQKAGTTIPQDNFCISKTEALNWLYLEESHLPSDNRMPWWSELVPLQGCPPADLYARVEIDALYYFPDDPPPDYYWAYYEPLAYVRFYSDAACTQPLVLPQSVNIQYIIREIAYENDITVVGDYTSPVATLTVAAGNSQVRIYDHDLLYGYESFDELDEYGNLLWYDIHCFLYLVAHSAFPEQQIRPPVFPSGLPPRYTPDFTVPCD